MKFSEPKSFRDAMFPVIRTCWIFGIGIFEYPIGNPQLVLSFCWSIAHLAVYLFVVSHAEVRGLSVTTDPRVKLHTFHLSTCFCTNFIISSMIRAWRSKAIMRFYRRIKVVNEKLNRLGIPEDYGITFKYQIVQLAISFVHIIVISAVSLVILMDIFFWQWAHIAFWIHASYQLIFSFMVGCIYCGCIRYIGNRFRHLNAHVLQSTSDRKQTKLFFEDFDYQESIPPFVREIHGNLRLTKAPTRRLTVHVLREARSIHRDLCLAATEMNQSFGIQIIFFVGMAFCNITSLLFTIYQSFLIRKPSFVQLVELIPAFCWLATYITAVYYLVYCCSIVSGEAQHTGVLIHDRVKPDVSSDVQAEIEVFSLQMMQNPLQFTAHGFFNLNYTMIRGMVGSVSTYLVIMIQLRSIYHPKSDMTSMTNFVTNSTI